MPLGVSTWCFGGLLHPELKAVIDGVAF